MKKPFMDNRISGIRLSGSITLYLALVLVITVVLVATLIESGRVNAVNARLKGITYMGLDSVFSEYARPVFEDYKAMMLWCKDGEFIKRFDKYVSHNIDVNGTSVLKPADLYRMKHEKTDITDVGHITDDGGKPFEDQICEYMKLFMVEELSEELLSDADIFKQADKLKKFSKKLKKHQKTFTAVEKSVGRLKDKIERAQRISDRPAEYLNGMGNALENYSATEDEIYLNDVYVNEVQLIDSKARIADSLDVVKSETETYHEKALDAKAAIEELEAELAVEEKGLTPAVYQSIEEEIADLKAKAGDSEADYYKIEENLKYIDEQKQKLDSLDPLINSLEGEIDPSSAAWLAGEVRSYESIFYGFDLSGLSINYDNTKTDKEGSGFLEEISNLISRGLLEYVAPEVSEKSADLSTVPSRDDDIKSTGGSDGLVNDAAKKYLFSEYIKTHFSRYTDVLPGKALDYEAEYILHGKSSDKQNIKRMIDRIVELRTGCNIISIFKDTKKKTEAMSLASAIIGFTGMPVLIKVMQLMILCAWSSAEAVMDAKTLFAGGKVPIIKDSTDWTLSLEGIKNFNVTESTPKESSKGIDYEEHLKIFLMIQKKNTQIIRTMDMIQLNMMKNENSDFRIRDCISGVRVDVKYTSKKLLVTIPFVRKYVWADGSDYGFEVIQEYSY